MGLNSRRGKLLLVGAVSMILLLSPSTSIAKGRHWNPAGTWLCTVDNPLIPAEDVLMNFNAGGTFTASTSASYLGLSLPETFVLGPTLGTWKTMGRRTLVTTMYAFVFSALETPSPMPPPGFLQGILAIPCHLEAGGTGLEGTCKVHVYLAEDPDGDGFTSSPYPPEGQLMFPPVEAGIACSRLPMMKTE